MTDPQSSVVLADQLIGMVVGGYRIETLLGEGGMGLVYQARHELIDRRFAIKVLRPEVADDVAMVKNFLAEAQTLSAIKHPNIIDIVGFGLLPDGRQYMVMEYLEGRTLEQEMADGRLSLERVFYLAEQTLSALTAAHSVEVIHRDLKPSNVFLAKGSGGIEVVKLLDFGLARHQPVALAGLGAVNAGVSMVAGTPEYVAPEQAQGGMPEKSSDLYAFGAMLFELVTGQLPFKQAPDAPDRIAALLHAHATQRAPTPAAVGVEVPAELSELLAELLQKNPADRPISADVVRLRVESMRQSLPAAQRPISLVVRSPTSTARLASPARRWPVSAAVVALIAIFVPLVILLGSGSGSAAVTQGRSELPLPAAPVVPPVLPPPAPVEVVESPPPPAPAPLPVAPEAPPKRARTRPAPLEMKSGCTPDARWRAASSINIQELQQLAANEPAHWSDFEKLEPALANAVNSASTDEQCEAVDRQIRKLARAWRP